MSYILVIPLGNFSDDEDENTSPFDRITVEEFEVMLQGLEEQMELERKLEEQMFEAGQQIMVSLDSFYRHLRTVYDNGGDLDETIALHCYETYFAHMFEKAIELGLKTDEELRQEFVNHFVTMDKVSLKTEVYTWTNNSLLQ